jgi:3-dehydroquinate synthase
LRRGDRTRLAAVVRRCCAIKAKVVEADEFETAPTGGRALLNLGHTFGHAIERTAGYGTYLHGEAVSIGLVCAAVLSEMLSLAPSGTSGRVARVLAAHGLPVSLREPLPVAALMEAMGRDKKVRAGRLRFVTLPRIGRAATDDTVAPEAAAAALLSVGAV